MAAQFFFKSSSSIRYTYTILFHIIKLFHVIKSFHDITQLFHYIIQQPVPYILYNMSAVSQSGQFLLDSFQSRCHGIARYAHNFGNILV